MRKRAKNGIESIRSIIRNSHILIILSLKYQDISGSFRVRVEFIFWCRFLLELLLRFPSQVSDQPLGGEGILGRHPITHHCVQEGLPLPRVETQHLGDRTRQALAHRNKTLQFF